MSQQSTVNSRQSRSVDLPARRVNVWGVRNHRRLDVWKKGCEVVVGVYLLTDLLPPSERYGLAAQMQRAAVSIPANIAEGASRGSKKEFLRFLDIAAGSLAELDTHIHVVQLLGLLEAEDCAEVHSGVGEVRRMLAGLMESIRRL